MMIVSSREFDGEYLQVDKSICMFSTCKFGLMSRLLIACMSHTHSRTILECTFACYASHSYSFVNLQLNGSVEKTFN